MAAPTIRPQHTSLADLPPKPTSLRIEFAVNLKSARETSAAIRAFLSEQGVPDGELFSYELCVAEACYNAIEYAKDPKGESTAFAEVIFIPEEIVLRVTDHTEGFTMPEKIPAPSPMSERGRGLFIIQSIMDDVEYIRGRNENVLVMRKRRNAHAALQVAK